jgi:hypothetical protein
MALAEEALKAGKTPLEVMLTRMRALDARGDDQSRREACQIASWAAPYVHARLSTQQISAEVQTRNVVRVPEKSASVEDWLDTYKPLIAALPTKLEN